MRVSTRLTLTGLSLLGVISVLATVLVSTTRAVRQELGKNEAASEVLSAVSGMRYLTLEYLLHREERPRAQWELRQASLAKLLSSAGHLAGTVDLDILSGLRQSNRTVADLFAQLSRAHASQGENASELAQELDARLTAQIVVRLERMIADALTLSERSRAGVLHAQRRSSEAVVCVVALIAIVVIATTLVTLRNVSEPLKRLREGTAIVGGGNLGFKLDVTRRDEIGDLALAFNAMTSQLRERQRLLENTQADLARVTRVATLGEMTTSIAHEINQPLCAIVNNASAGLRWLSANNLDEARQSASLVIADSHRASEIVARIRAMAKKSPPQKKWTDVPAALEAAVAMTQAAASKHGVHVCTHFAAGVPKLWADAIQIQQVVLNLIVNAIEAMHDLRPEVPRRVTVSCTNDAERVRISVDDSGPGVVSDCADRMFEAFFTTKSEGLGMGLAVSRSIVEAHGGSLWATPNPERGLTVQFTLPLVEGEVS